MKYRDWFFLLGITSVITILTNLIGYQVSVVESIPGILILCAIALGGVFLGKTIPIKLPTIMYVSLLGVIIASPISPVGEVVRYHADRISFMAPVTAVGAFAGISMGKDFDAFRKQSGKMVLIGLLIFTGTFVFSAIVGHIVLGLTGVI